MTVSQSFKTWSYSPNTTSYSRWLSFRSVFCRVAEMSSSYEGRGASCWLQCQGWRGRLLTLSSRKRSFFVRYGALQLLHLWIFRCIAELHVPDNLRLIESRVLMKILGPKREEGPGDWRRLCIEELHDLYCSHHHHLLYSLNPSLCTDTIGCRTCHGGIYSIVKYYHYT